MQHRETPYGYVLALDPGDELIRSLISFARRNDVEAATLHGLGAVDHLDLGSCTGVRPNHSRATFLEALQACALVGNIALLDGEPFPHVHGVFARADFSTVGGHVFEAVCSVALELAVHTAPRPMERVTADRNTLDPLKLEATA